MKIPRIPGFNSTQQPWYHSWKNAHRRCTDPENNRYRYYGAKGIHFELPFWETGWLYVRDKAFAMKNPQIHRLDPRKNYTLKNCCFIPRAKHCSITHRGSKRSMEACRRMSLAGGTQFGIKHPNAKLTLVQIRCIRTDTARGSGVRLAKQFGVARSTISAIKTGKNWRKTCPSAI